MTKPADPLLLLETAIAADIHNGALPSGSWLKQIVLQKRYGCSRGDVRRALDRLAAQRLVVQLPNCGYRVHGLDTARLDELRQVRRILEGAAAELMLGRADAAALERLRQLAGAFSRAVQHGTLLDQHEANQAFHAALLALCPNAELVRLIRELRLRMPSAVVTQWPEAGWAEESARQHHAMVEALAAENGTAFRAAVCAHIRSAAVPAAAAPPSRRRGGLVAAG
ncbi:GntR family transcriptional regulator [Roseomonas haemaphysalidis]|nr:GntR family transcriptional regulator [Roseomonas haemaphysalidis]